MDATQRKRIGLVVAAVGAVVLVLSVFADAFGYGEGDFGWKQWVGTLVGLAAIAVGLALAFWRRDTPTAEPVK